jgi:hypothetical protein
MSLVLSRTHQTLTVTLLLGVLASVSTQSQQPTQPKSAVQHTGSVIGMVLYDDSRAPARFAEVRLIPKPADGAQTDSSAQPGPHVRMASGTTEIDGHFRIDGVPVGDYLAGAVKPGYLALDVGVSEEATDDKLRNVIASIPTVHVTEGQVASVNLSLHRGGVITGRVIFADGSPAIDTKVEWQASNYDIDRARLAPESRLRNTLREFEYNPMQGRKVETDDQGRYRIYGLPPGKYVLSTIIASKLGTGGVIMSDGTSPNDKDGLRPQKFYPNMMSVFAPGVFRRSEAKAFVVRGDEQIADADLRIDLTGLHTIKGAVLAGEDHHVPQQAILTIFENGKQLSRMATLEEDGSFEIDYVPSGTYTVKIFGAPDELQPAKPGSPPVLRRYQALKLDVIVGEHDTILGNLLLSPLKPGEKENWP